MPSQTPPASGGVKIVKIGRFENRCRKEGKTREGTMESSGLDAVFHAEACAFDKDDFGVVEKAVEDGGGNGAVAVEDWGPLLEGFVGGEHDGAALVALADDLEKEVSAALVDGKIAELVQLCWAQHNLTNVEFPKMWSWGQEGLFLDGCAAHRLNIIDALWFIVTPAIR
jgi:hypothetical protein